MNAKDIALMLGVSKAKVERTAREHCIEPWINERGKPKLWNSDGIEQIIRSLGMDPKQFEAK